MIEVFSQLVFLFPNNYNLYQVDKYLIRKMCLCPDSVYEVVDTSSYWFLQ